MNKFHRAALMTANKVRRALGKEPVDHLYAGIPSSGWSCPITSTIYDSDPDLRERFVIFTNRTRVFIFDRQRYEENHGPLSFSEDGTPHIGDEEADFDITLGSDAIRNFEVPYTSRSFISMFDQMLHYREKYDDEWQALIAEEYEYAGA